MLFDQQRDYQRSSEQIRVGFCPDCHYIYENIFNVLRTYSRFIIKTRLVVYAMCIPVRIKLTDIVPDKFLH